MAKKLQHHHLFHFVLLLAILALSIALIATFRYHPQEQIYIVLALGCFYVIWGAMHHDRERNLHPQILLEYIAIATLGSAILISIITKL